MFAPNQIRVTLLSNTTTTSPILAYHIYLEKQEDGLTNEEVRISSIVVSWIDLSLNYINANT